MAVAADEAIFVDRDFVVKKICLTFLFEECDWSSNKGELPVSEAELRAEQMVNI